MTPRGRRINLVVYRLDPVRGTQSFTVISLQVAEPDAQIFAGPAESKVVDQRVTAPVAGK